MSEDRLIEGIKILFRINLGIKKTERVLIFTDKINPGEKIAPEDKSRRERIKDLARLIAEVCKGYCKEVLYMEYKALMSHGMEPPERLWKMAFGDKAIESMNKIRLMNPLINKRANKERVRKAENIVSKNRKYAVDVIIGLSNYSTSHTRFRDLLTRRAGARYASMPLFDPDMFFRSMNVNWKVLERKTKNLAKEVGKADLVELSALNGTRLSLSKEGRKVGADTGILVRPGSFGNLPAGEVYFAPVEGTAEGRLVIEWAPTQKLEYPVTLMVKKGRVTEVSGEDRYRCVIEKKLKENDDFRNIAELGIGTNDKATRPDNILESEKISGTVHIALGDNSSFGGKVRTPFHQDFIFFRPTLRLIHKNRDEELILDKGRLLI
jgi:leucyl aminopeptidase (aminopeptidase T)